MEMEIDPIGEETVVELRTRGRLVDQELYDDLVALLVALSEESGRVTTRQASPAGGKMRRPAGRPRHPVHEWARNEVYLKGRDPSEVRREWEKKLQERGDNLADPYASWKKVIKLPPKAMS